MDLDPRLQRALDRVELVSGSIGDPGQGRMCLMSLVAFLAGEPHSDAPGCASPVVQAFAVAVNDQCTNCVVTAEARQFVRVVDRPVKFTDEGRIRVDANGAWTVDEAEHAIHAFAEHDLEYVEQPCRTVEELAELRIRLARSQLDVLIAADESIRRADDPALTARYDADLARATAARNPF